MFDFLFLSKLLPLFIYPLGLSSVLLIISLILFWKYPRWMPIPVSLALAILLLSSNGWITTNLVKSLEWQNLPPSDLPQAEAIVILGGATKAPTKPRPMVDVNEQGDRVLYAVKLYQEHKAPLIIPSGGRIAWRGSGQQAEATDMTQLLVMMGIPASAIIPESNSFNTYQNAVNVGQILESKGIKRILLVTSALHMPRSLAIFQHQGIEVIPAPTDFLISEQEVAEIGNTPEAIMLNILPDSERLDRTTKVIKEYIGMLIYRLKGWL